MVTAKKEKMDQIFDKFTQKNSIKEGVLLIEDTKGTYSYQNSYGGKELDSPLLMASITKLFTTTCILILKKEGKLKLTDPLSLYLDDKVLKGIHIYKNKDYSPQLTIEHLLFQTSGLPDAFVEGKENLTERVLREDFAYTLEENIASVKRLKPHFEPGKKRKAYYSDINFDLLGQIIMKKTDLSLAQAYHQYIISPLGLTHTYLPESAKDRVPSIYYKNQLIERPKFIISSGASGGAITTARELMVFLKGFFGGKLFDNSVFKQLSHYNSLQLSMTPIAYGGGFMQISLEGITTLFRGKGELLGHSGTTGSFAFYYPREDMFFVGDLNQMSNPSLPVKMVMQLAMGIKS